MSDRERPNVTFGGSQNAGVINNVGGDQVNYGGMHGTIGEVHQGLADVATIRELLKGVPLTEIDRETTRDAVDRLEGELRKPEPDTSKAAGALEDLTGILKAAGALAGAGLALVDPIGSIAIALGGAAGAVLRALGR
jgi:hypothetical protein